MRQVKPVYALMHTNDLIRECQHWSTRRLGFSITSMRALYRNQIWSNFIEVAESTLFEQEDILRAELAKRKDIEIN